MYFADFRRNNSVFIQNNGGFEKYQLQKKFIFWQLVMKIENFAILGKITACLRKRKKTHTLKTINRKVSQTLQIFDNMVLYLRKKIMHVK